MNEPAYTISHPHSPMAHHFTTWVLIAVGIALGVADTTLGGADEATEHAQDFQAQVAPFVQTFCIRCHGAERERGGVRFDKYTELTQVAADHRMWARILDRIETREMPPSSQQQPTESQREAIVRWIKAELAHVPCDGPPRPGRVTLRRLNRVEYDNTIRDLFGLDLHPAEDFPADDSGYGFDNNADVLSISPLLMERYLAAAERIAQAVIAGGQPPPPVVKRIGGAGLARGASPGDEADDEYTLASNGEIGTKFEFPVAGTYTVRVRAYGQRAGPDLPSMAFCLDGRDIGTVKVKGTEGQSQVDTFKVRTDRGQHRLSVKFLNDYYDPENRDPKLRGDRNLIIESLELEAPRDSRPQPKSEAYRRVMVCTPGPDAASRQNCARKILGAVARRAFRRPVTSEETDRFVGLVTQVVDDGGSFDQGIELALQAILVSPDFLFLVESGPAPERLQPDGTYRLTDFELAARLAYFLWSSMPDEALFKLAQRDELHDPRNLEAQVARMLKDPRSRALADNFAGQWLGIRKLEDVAPDPQRFPAFDAALRTAMAEESRQCFEYVLRTDRSIMDFIQADYTFVNERLSNHYGMRGVKGEQFRKVKTTADRPGGVLGQASVLTITSNPTRTSPVKRGKWVLEEILGTPPPQPPPDVPPLEEGSAAELKGTVRQRLEQHRSRADCKSCHAQMDPLGFGLENYDAVGVWRERDGEFPVDATGTLPSGESFNGPGELRQLLLARRDQFRHCLTSKLLTYALGRGLEPADECTVQAICTQVSAADDRFPVLIMEIVKSPPFRLRSLAENAP